jgi:hypothetical protein
MDRFVIRGAAAVAAASASAPAQPPRQRRLEQLKKVRFCAVFC